MGGQDGQAGAAGKHPRAVGLLVALGAFVLLLVLPAPTGMSPEAWRVTAVAVLMAVLWVTEALPLAATSLVPLVAFPLLGIARAKDAAAPYADPLIFLFLGGFVLGLGLQRWNLHRRIALAIVGRLGTSPARLVGGFLLATAFLSMWVSNTATAVMMLPVALSVIGLVEGAADGGSAGERRNLAVGLLLAVAYGASIGGLATLIGTPPNALLAAYMARTHGVEVGFAQWMALGVPLSLVMLALAWVLLAKVMYPVAAGAVAGAEEAVGREARGLGPLSGPELRVGLIFLLTALAWVFRPLVADYVPGLDDTVIAIAAALALFALPSGAPGGGRLLDWGAAREVPWGVLLLFGGGLSLAAAIADSGLAEWLGALIQGLGGLPTVLVVLAATLAIIFLTELTSNTATAAAFLPLVGSAAVGLGLDPFLLAVPVALAASCAFMLPVATPPNAIVYGSGHLAIADMARVGLWLNLLGTLVITAATYAAVGTLLATPAKPG